MKRVWLIIISVILLAGVCWAADKPVSQLPATENIKNEDLFLVSQYNAGNYFSRHITFANLKKKLDELYQAIGGGGGEGIAVSDIYTGTINDGDLTKYDQSTGKLKSAGAAAGYTEPQSNLPICRTGAGTVGACTNLTDKTIPTYDDVGVKIVMVTGDPDEVIECEGRDRTYVIGANANYFFQLPADPSGIKYCFANGAYETVISIVPDGTDVIRFIGDTTGKGDGLVSTGAYQDYVCLLGLNTSTWRVIQTMGTWAIDEVKLPYRDVYACDYGGDIYKQAGGTGDFVALGQTSRNWYGMAAAPNGDVYASVHNGDIYKQAGGAGNFVALNQTTRKWRGMAAAPNGDVYASVYNGDIYKQAGGIGDFVALGQTSRTWRGVAAAPNGDVYAYDDGDIYKQSGGTGDFVALSQEPRDWQAMAAAPNGDVYACDYGGDIYKQTGGTGDFVALSQTSRNWAGLAAAPNGDVYASVYNGDIYKQTGGTGDFVALGQTSRKWYGMAAAPDEPEEPEEPEPEPTGVILPWIITGG